MYTGTNPSEFAASDRECDCVIVSRRPPPAHFSRRTAGRAFLSGLFAGVFGTLLLLFLAGSGVVLYVQRAARMAAIPALAPAPAPAGSRVEMYFPLERFLAWRSTPSLRLSLAGDVVQVRFALHPFSTLRFHVPVEIHGTPEVERGLFRLAHVGGSVGNIPLPTGVLLDAMAAEGAKYGVRVNANEDELAIDRSFGQYRLVGYDAMTRDLVISIPVSSVEDAARGSRVL